MKGKGIRAEHYTSDDLPTLVLTCGQDIPLSSQGEALRKEIRARFPNIMADHFAYIAMELGKAQMALDWELPYTQG